MDQADSLLVDGDQQELRVVGVRGLLDLEERRAEGGPAVDDLEEGHLGLLRAEAGVLVVGLDDLPLPVLRRHRLDQVRRDELRQHLVQPHHLLLRLAELDSVDERRQEDGLLPRALVVT